MALTCATTVLRPPSTCYDGDDCDEELSLSSTFSSSSQESVSQSFSEEPPLPSRDSSCSSLRSLSLSVSSSEPSSSNNSNNSSTQYLVERSKFVGTPPTVFFGTDANPPSEEAAALPQVLPKVFLKYTGVNCNVVKQAFARAGFRNCPKDKDHFNAVWASPMKVNHFQSFKAYQKVNHFPGTWELGRKDRLYRNISKMRRRHGDKYDILPFAFELPGDYDEFLKDWERRPNQWYIIKPRSSSRGRGIKLLKKLSDVEKKKSGPRECIVQRYIKDPLLIDGYKFDMRVYVLVTCFDPLRVYVAREGLARFATEPYSSDSSKMKSRRCHLTNVSINSKSKKFVANQDAAKDGEGSKWTLSALRRHLESNEEFGVTSWEEQIWSQVKDLVIKAVISVDAKVNTLVKMHVPGNNCFELYGADVMLDSKLKAWLIEFNTGPALNTPTPLNKAVKSRVVTDMFHIVGFAPVDKKKHERGVQASRQNRLTGIGLQKMSATHRDTNQAQTMVFDGVKESHLPDVVRETEAEHRRSVDRVFERAFPCSARPSAYHSLFEVQRYNNIVVKRWLIAERRKRIRLERERAEQEEEAKRTMMESPKVDDALQATAAAVAAT
ncbi:tubulin polyglutamylase TTLL4 [Chloropicon primus]|uniref:Tubulin--tyrosine ligase-like protein 5 n=1 Tax=Chloropicon primus TaxID=1764295 RepID=A0A5B8MK97_9CHLO|nr:tubulin polyglutamylase TTLL4 [Chloropicon primus]|eukprot:QDZ21058.1 tubulin polyglutamylase TTLL4 [Chloropicon primus]